MSAATAIARRPPRVLLFTDEAACRRRGHSVVSSIARVFADVVIDEPHQVVVCVRDKHHDVAHVANTCRALQAVLAAHQVDVAVHTHVALVAPLGLRGVHVSLDEPALKGGRGNSNTWRFAKCLNNQYDSGAERPNLPTLQQVRAQLPPTALLGVSAHPRFTGDVCAIDDVDYATWSPVFSPASKQDARAPIGVAALHGHRTPVLALGGIDDDNAALCLAHGAAGVAVIGAVLSSAAPHRALTSLLTACAVGWHPRRRTPHARLAA